MEFIEKHPEKSWNWHNISMNSLKKEKEEFIQKRYREHLSAFKIQQNWFKAKLCPEYKLCQKRVNEFYDNVLKPHYDKL